MNGRTGKRNILQRITAAALTLLTVLFLLPAVPVKAVGSTAFVRVLLSLGEPQTTTVTVYGSYRIAECGKFFTDGKLTLTADKKTVTVSHSELGELYSGSTVTVERLNLHRDAGKLSMRVADTGRSYLGHMIFTASDSKLTAVNRVPLSHYLYGVVAYEMSNTFPVEALKTQSMAAKNYVLPLLGKKGTYDIGDTSSDQVYKGFNPEHTGVIEAVDDTMNTILLLNGTYLTCYYSASNGGWRDLPSKKWPKAASMDAGYRDGYDEYDLKNPGSPVETAFLPTVFTKKAVGNDLLYALILEKAAAACEKEGLTPVEVLRVENARSTAEDGTMEGLNHTRAVVTLRALVQEQAAPAAPAEQAERAAAAAENTAGDVLSLLPIFSEPTPAPTAAPRQYEREISFSFELAELTERGIFTNSKLRLTYITAGSDGYTLTHARYGHGVGMSQRGAQQMALEGKTWYDIVAYYYGGATLAAYDYVCPEAIYASSGGLLQSTPTPAPRPTATPAASDLPTQSAPAATPAPTPQTQSEGTSSAPVNGQMNVQAPTGESSSAACVKGDDTVLLAAPEEGAAALAALENNTAVTLTGLNGDWYAARVDATGKSGFIHSDRVIASADTVLAEGTLTGDQVNLRMGAGTSYPSEGKLRSGTALEILALTNGWYRVRELSEGRVGYVSKTYVNITTPKAEAPAEKRPTLIAAVADTVSPVTDIFSAAARSEQAAGLTYFAYGTVQGEGILLHDGPSADASALVQLRAGEGLYVIAAAGGWYYVRRMESGAEGFAPMESVDLTGKELKAGAPIGTATVTAAAVLRSGPDLSDPMAGKVFAGERVQVLSAEGSTCLVLLADRTLAGCMDGALLNFDGQGKAVIQSGSLAAVRSEVSCLMELPDRGSACLLRILQGSRVAVLEINESWARIRCNGLEGYVPLSELQFYGRSLP